MNDRIILYDFCDDNIHINIEARFEEENLVIDGYDIGKTVKDYWGDSDYEYKVTVKKEHIPLLIIALGIPNAGTKEILTELARRFNGNTCYSEFRQFLDDHHIPSEGFSWI